MLKSISLKGILFLLVFAVLCSLLIGPGLAAAQDAGKVTIQTPPVAAALPLLWMQEEGELAELVDLEVKISPDHSRALALIAKDEIDMMVTGVNVGAKAYNQGVNIKLMNVNTWAVDYLLTNGFAVDSWSDLEGKTLSLPLKGGPLDFLARYFMRENGVNPEDVKIVYRPLPNGARYFMAGKVDAIMLPEPLVTVSLSKGDRARLEMDLQEEWGKLYAGDRRIPFVGLFVSGSFAEENGHLTEIINGLYMKGIEWVNNNPEAAARLGAEYFSQPAPLLQKSFERINLNYYSRQETRELIERFNTAILEMYPELLGGRMPDEAFYF